MKKQFVEIGKRIWTRGYVASNDGNMTVRINDKEILATPTGISKGMMAVEMISKCDMDGNVISGNPKYRPSSEVKMHLEVYKQRPDVNAVVHAHPAYATSFAVAGIPLDKCVLPEAIIVIGSVPIAPYGLPSTAEIPDRIYPVAALRSFMSECDYVVVTVPLTDATHHLINGLVLAQMKPHAVLVNVARGAVVDQSALVDALEKGKIGGAALDVFEEEPLPEDSPLWQLPNVILSPHISGLTPHYDLRATDLFAENLRRFVLGDPLLNVVDRKRNY